MRPGLADVILVSLPPLTPTIFLLLPWGSLISEGREGFDGDIPFRAECSKVSNFVHNVWLWISMFGPI